MSVTADAYRGFVLAAELSVQHLHASVGLDLWMVSCVDSVTRPPTLAPLLAEVGAAGDEGPDRQVVVARAGPLADRIPMGTGLPWLTSFCRLMVDGQGPSFAPDVGQVPAYAEVQQTVSELRLRHRARLRGSAAAVGRRQRLRHPVRVRAVRGHHARR